MNFLVNISIDFMIAGSRLLSHLLKEKTGSKTMYMSSEIQGASAETGHVQEEGQGHHQSRGQGQTPGRRRRKRRKIR